MVWVRSSTTHQPTTAYTESTAAASWPAHHGGHQAVQLVLIWTV